jgi:CO dehydrogenase maturation factor
MRVAVCGKGGVGKTTFAALLIYTLRKRGETPILAVDADPGFGLAFSLGVLPKKEIGALKDRVRSEQSVPKSILFEQLFYEALEERDGFDILCMGRGEGRGCYCGVNALLQECMQNLCRDYRHVIVDLEAGLEQISRGIIESVDTLLVLYEPTKKAEIVAHTLMELASELYLQIKKTYLIENKVKKECKDSLFLPFDESVQRLDAEGESIFSLPEDSVAAKAMERIVSKVFGG